MIPVKEVTSGQFVPISGNQKMVSLDGEEFATLGVLLHESWTDQDRARFGVYLAEPFEVPEGKITVGEPTYEWDGDVLRQVYEVADPPPPSEAEIDMLARRAGEAALIEAAAINLIEDGDTPAETKAKLIGIYRRWAIGESVAVGDLRRYEETLYRCVQAHTTQSDWAPPNVPALWVAVAPAGTIAAWVQPAGAHDAYQVGAIVTHNGQTWICTTANNVWEPGVFGWSVYTP